MQAVILAAGAGTRMAPLTKRRPKPLLPVAGHPLLWWTLSRCHAAGLRDVVVVVHHEGGQVESFLRSSHPAGLRIRVVRQSKPLGTGHALGSARRAVHGPFVLIYGDVLPEVADLQALSRGQGHVVAAAQVDDVGAFGALGVQAGKLREVREKSGRAGRGLVNAGLFRFEHSIFGHVRELSKSARGEYELTDALSVAAREEGVRVHRLKRWIETGRPWDLLAAQENVMADLRREVEGRLEPGVVVKGPVHIGKGTVVKTGTYIEGPVWIGEDCRIGPRTYLRPGTSIGSGCHVGASVEIKNSILMDRTNVPHLSYVGDSVIGSDCNLGAGTTTANLKITPGTVRATWKDGAKLDTRMRKLGAIVGDGTRIGINCSIAPGTIIGADCLVGMAKSLSGWIPDGTRVF